LTKVSSSGGAREDLDETVRNVFQRFIRNIQQGTGVTFAPAATVNGHHTFTSCSFTPSPNPNSVTVTYYSTQATGRAVGEYALMETQVVTATSAVMPGYPKTWITDGITLFYFQPTPCNTYDGVTYFDEYAFCQMYINCFTSVANRPLPDQAQTPLTLATLFDIRNGATQLHPAASNPTLYPSP